MQMRMKMLVWWSVRGGVNTTLFPCFIIHTLDFNFVHYTISEYLILLLLLFAMVISKTVYNTTQLCLEIAIINSTIHCQVKWVCVQVEKNQNTCKELRKLYLNRQLDRQAYRMHNDNNDAHTQQRADSDT